MPVSKHSLQSQPNASVLLRALFALSLGWLLLPVFGSVSYGVEQAKVLVEAELRVGEQAPAPVAEIATTQASLRALNARIRSGSNQLLASASTAASFAASLLPLRARALTQQHSVDPTRASAERVLARHWPLPRSSCRLDRDHGDDPSALRG